MMTWLEDGHPITCDGEEMRARSPACDDQPKILELLAHVYGLSVVSKRKKSLTPGYTGGNKWQSASARA